MRARPHPRSQMRAKAVLGGGEASRTDEGADGDAGEAWVRCGPVPARSASPVRPHEERPRPHRPRRARLAVRCQRRRRAQPAPTVAEASYAARAFGARAVWATLSCCCGGCRQDGPAPAWWGLCRLVAPQGRGAAGRTAIRSVRQCKCAGYSAVRWGGLRARDRSRDGRVRNWSRDGRLRCVRPTNPGPRAVAVRARRPARRPCRTAPCGPRVSGDARSVFSHLYTVIYNKRLHMHNNGHIIFVQQTARGRPLSSLSRAALPAAARPCWHIRVSMLGRPTSTGLPLIMRPITAPPQVYLS